MKNLNLLKKKRRIYVNFFDKHVNIGEGKGKSTENMTKIHFTDKGAMYMYLTSVRANHLKVGLEKENVTKYDIKYEKCKGTNKMLGGSVMSGFYTSNMSRKNLIYHKY